MPPLQISRSARTCRGRIYAALKSARPSTFQVARLKPLLLLPITFRVYGKEKVMTTIAGISTIGAGGSSGGGAASEIAAINKQIAAITSQLKSLADNHTLTQEQKSEQQQMLESQIQMLYAQIAQIQQREAEKAEQQQQTEQPVSARADGINRPTPDNQLDVYI